MSGLGKNHWCPCRCVTPWYLKRGFLGFCFFDEDETHLVNLFSSIKSHLEGLLVQTSASGKGITVGSLPVDRHEWWTAKPVPYIRVCIHMTSVAWSSNRQRPIRVKRTSGSGCRVSGRISGVHISVIPWYLKRGFLGLCFFHEDETHLVNLFSGIESYRGGCLVQSSASGKGTVDVNKWLTPKPVPYF